MHMSSINIPNGLHRKQGRGNNFRNALFVLYYFRTTKDERDRDQVASVNDDLFVSLVDCCPCACFICFIWYYFYLQQRASFIHFINYCYCRNKVTKITTTSIAAKTDKNWASKKYVFIIHRSPKSGIIYSP